MCMLVTLMASSHGVMEKGPVMPTAFRKNAMHTNDCAKTCKMG